MNMSFLVKLTARRWALPILSHLNSGVAGRQAPLISSTGAARASFLDSMGHLQALGLVHRNTGHGHPLRPEYQISEQGRRWAEMADEVMALTREETAMKLVQRSWALPVLLAAWEARYFGELRGQLNPVTDRALSQVLKGLGEAAWIEREVDPSGRPPRATYRSVDTGARIAQVLAAA